MGFWRLKDADGVPIDLADLGCNVTQALGVGKPAPKNIVTPYGQSDGGQYQRRVYPPRQFSLVATLTGNDWDDFQIKRQALTDLVDRGHEQVVQYARGKTLEINCRYNGGLEGNNVTGYQEQIPLQFIAPDPFWIEAGAPTSVTLNVNSNTTVTNGGTAPAYPIITLAGEGAITRLDNLTTGKVIIFDLAVLSGEVVTIDLRPGFKTVSSDVRGSIFYSISRGSNLTTWALEKGDNTILLTATGELALLAEDGSELLTEGGDTIIVSDTLNLTTRTLAFNRRHWSYDAVAT